MFVMTSKLMTLHDMVRFQDLRSKQLKKNDTVVTIAIGM